MKTILVCYSICVLVTLFSSINANQIQDAGLRVVMFTQIIDDGMVSLT